MPCDSTPRITLGAEWGPDASARVPVVRSKLHGHRGIEGYDPRRVELIPNVLPPARRSRNRISEYLPQSMS